MMPFSSTCRMFVPSAMNTLPSTPTAIPENNFKIIIKKNMMKNDSAVFLNTFIFNESVLVFPKKRTCENS